RIEVTLPSPLTTPPSPLLVGEPIPLDILYEDPYLLVINKPAGLVVHPAPGNPSGTLVNALLFHCHRLSTAGDLQRPGIVHRLDKDTSGLLVVAKDDLSHRRLAYQLKQRQIKREYLALVHGWIREEEGVIDAPIGRHPRQRKKMAVVPGSGRPALTSFRVKERFTHFTLLQVRLQTGRTHQIRVHMAYIHHPVVGDPVYGGRGSRETRGEVRAALARLQRQALHAWRLGFWHPQSKEYLEFTAPLPADIAQVLQVLRQQEKEEAPCLPP
ncbi:MAG: RluA family pseudouridine synthase, partial [Nitrospinota bacterium]